MSAVKETVSHPLIVISGVRSWEPSVEDVHAFISRGHKLKQHLDASEDGDGWSGGADEEEETEGLPSVEVNLDG